jgi:putative ABC transport system ATP-binding protein
MLEGKDVSRMSEDDRTDLRKGRLGFVFQSFNLIDELCVSENVELPLLYMNCPKKERRDRVAEVVDRVAMTHRAQHFPSQLSGGQQQRVAIARAVISHPTIILADEPTGNLDSKHGKEVMELLKELHREGTTIIMVTHSQRDANYADRIVNLFDGEIVSEVEM